MCIVDARYSPGLVQALVRTLPCASSQGLKQEPKVHLPSSSLHSPGCQVVSEFGRGSALEACPLLTRAQGGSKFKCDPLSSKEGGEATSWLCTVSP